MLFKQFVPIAVALTLGTSQVSAASHGEVEDYDGGKIRWQQVAKGVFTGVPADQWDDNVNALDDEEWDFAKMHNESEQRRDLVLESRNLQSFCQATTDCVKGDGLVQLVGCMGAFVEAAAFANTAGTSLWDFFQQPFIATVSGATVAGIAVNKATSSAPDPVPAECSTSNSDKDALLSALSAAVARDPDAYSVAFDVSGPTTYYTVTVTAVPEDQTPPTPVVGKCFTARALSRSAAEWSG